jgi:hypothetical protein
VVSQALLARGSLLLLRAEGFRLIGLVVCHAGVRLLGGRTGSDASDPSLITPPVSLWRRPVARSRRTP